MQQRFLVRRNTSEVFIWTELLSKRKDLEEVFAENVQEALKKEAMPDPRKMSLEQLESMTKGDLLIFAKIKLGVDLPAEKTKADLQDEIKLIIFTNPGEQTVTAPKAETRAFNQAAEARRMPGA